MILENLSMYIIAKWLTFSLQFLKIIDTVHFSLLSFIAVLEKK